MKAGAAEGLRGGGGVEEGRRSGGGASLLRLSRLHSYYTVTERPEEFPSSTIGGAGGPELICSSSSRRTANKRHLGVKFEKRYQVAFVQSERVILRV